MNYTPHEIIDHIQQSLALTENYQTKLPLEVFHIEGFSGVKTRIFYNHLCSYKFQDRPTHYLEVGVWQGSSFISALHGNTHVKAVCIDNWSEFEGPKETFRKNVESFLPNADYEVMNTDFFDAVLPNDRKFDIYLYDGPHEEEDHYKAITHAWKSLADTCVIIIDDWAWDKVRQGTFRALDDLKATIIYKHEIPSTSEDQHKYYWNGMGIFVIQK